MLEIFDMMKSDTIEITGNNGTKATLTKAGALVVLTIISDRRIGDDELRRVFPIPADTPPSILIDTGPHKRSRTSWIL